jgi:hypothetical protein
MLLAEIPFDPAFVHAMVQGQTITEFSNSDPARLIRRAWEQICVLAGAGQSAEVI